MSLTTSASEKSLWMQSNKALLTINQFHGYQTRAYEHCLRHPQAMLWLDMGLGKTIITLSAIVSRMMHLQVYGTLVLAPLRVIQSVWKQEAGKWDHTQHLKFSLIHGNAQRRHRAMRVPADIYLLNYENLTWFVNELIAVYLSKGKYPPFNMVVFDEVSLLKDSTTKRHKALRTLLPYLPYRIGLTGTPAANGYLDLFGQFLAVDSGERLGFNITDYKTRYFETGYNAYDVTLRNGADARIQERISDITLQMNSADYLSLPDVIVNDVYVPLPPRVRDQYDKLERDMFMELDSGVDMDVNNAAALCNKCLQAAAGAVYYDEARNWETLHDEKLKALDDIVEEAAGSPLLILYEFQHDLHRLRERYPQATFLRDVKGEKGLHRLIESWNRGEIPLLVCHPKSAGHGLNLQYGGHVIVWLGLTWSLDLYQQANARLNRQGQKKTVIQHRILCPDTLDEVVRDRLQGKDETQESLRKTIARYRKSRGYD